MTLQYLILRCHPNETLSLSTRYPDLNLLCPTTVIIARKGPSRARTHVALPILPSFLFYPSLDHSIPKLPSRLHLMRRPYTVPDHPHVFEAHNPLPPKIPRSPPSPYAYCSLSEISILTSQGSNLSKTETFGNICCGSQVEVTQGLLAGIIGIVAQIRKNGDIILKVQQHLGWQINTCIVRASVLRLL